MQIRKWILWGFFALLGLNVLAGCYGLVIMEDDIFGPAIGGAIATAVACLLLYPASWLSLLKHGKHASWVAMGWVTLTCLMFKGLFFTWTNSAFRRGRDWEEFFIVLIIAMMPAAVLMGLGAYLKRFKALFVSSWILIIATALFMVMLTTAGFCSEILRNWRLTNLLMVLTVLEACVGIGLAVLFAGPWRWYKALALVGTAVTCVLITMDVMRVYRVQQSNVWQVGIGAILAIVIAYFNLMMCIPIKPFWGRMVRNVALGLGVLDAAVMMYLCAFAMNIRGKQETAILMLFGMILFVMITLTFVVAFKAAVDAIKIRRNDIPSQFHYSQLQITCPHCQTAQLLTEAGQHCCTCGIQFHFRITEPHCANCEYLLIGQSTGNCPECGHPLSENLGTPVGQPA
ncbi:MAG: hypothetical protein CMJ19_21245 [Phycisphaeraceae bacterium]|nr:hypothetical protein [Phycisphaeraceae bacterium]